MGMIHAGIEGELKEMNQNQKQAAREKVDKVKIEFRVHVPDEKDAGLWGTDAKITIEEDNSYIIEKEFIDAAKEALADLYDTPIRNVLTEDEYEKQQKANEDFARTMEKNGREAEAENRRALALIGDDTDCAHSARRQNRAEIEAKP